MKATVTFQQVTSAHRSATVRKEVSETNKMNQQLTQEPPKKDTKKWSMLALVVLLAGSLSTNFFYINNNMELKQSHDKEVLRLDSMLSVKLMVDKQLADTKSMIDQYHSENESIKSMLTSANAEIEQQKATVNKLYKENASIDVFNKQLNEARNLNKRLQGRIQDLLTENNLLATEALQLKQSLAHLENLQKAQPEKAEAVSELQVQHIQVKPLRKKWSGHYKDTDQAYKTARLAVKFEIASTTVTPACDKTIHVVLTDPHGKVLSEGSTHHFTTKAGVEGKYTWTRLYNCQHKAQTFAFNWNQDNKFAAGVYTAEVFSNGHSIGSTQFILK